MVFIPPLNQIRSTSAAERKEESIDVWVYQFFSSKARASALYQGLAIYCGEWHQLNYLSENN